MRRSLSVRINGDVRTDEVEPRLLLVHYLREVVGLTGTHVGCDTSNCGACTILIDGASAKSCTVLAVQADGCDLTTIEGVATDGHPSPVQEGFWRRHGLQCGYCTPGMIMSATALLARNAHPSEAAIREGIEGNLCRCTGYEKIVESVAWAADHPEGSGLTLDSLVGDASDADPRQLSPAYAQVEQVASGVAL